MNYLLKRVYYFSAAHRIYKVNDIIDSIHGHNFKVTCNFKNVDPGNNIKYHTISINHEYLDQLINKIIKDKYDHCLLLGRNDPLIKILKKDKITIICKNPTLELICQTLYFKIASLKELTNKKIVLESISLSDIPGSEVSIHESKYRKYQEER